MTTTVPSTAGSPPRDGEPLTAEELLAGSAATYSLAVPASLLGSAGADVEPGLVAGQVTVRPLTVSDLLRIGSAARDDDDLTAALIISQALVQPSLSVAQVQRLPAGLARFLVGSIEDRSGIATTVDALGELVQAPLAKACFILAREFGWTPEQVSGMTIGQILLFLQMNGAQGGPP